MKEGLEAIIFTADGDMRQALNNLQATHFGFGLVDSAAVFKVYVLSTGDLSISNSNNTSRVRCKSWHCYGGVKMTHTIC